MQPHNLTTSQPHLDEEIRYSRISDDARNERLSPHAGYFDAYYDGLLRLFAFMHLSGHYRIIEP